MIYKAGLLGAQEAASRPISLSRGLLKANHKRLHTEVEVVQPFPFPFPNHLTRRNLDPKVGSNPSAGGGTSASAWLPEFPPPFSIRVNNFQSQSSPEKHKKEK